jgi:cysteine desulfurase
MDIYLDSNATSAILPAALEAATAAMAHQYGNPSSTHATGLQARALLDSVRARARRLLGAGDGRLLFTSGATEGIQTAVLSALCAVRQRRQQGLAMGRLLVYGATEHKAVPESLAHWNMLLGLDLDMVALPVGADGRHDLAALRELAPDAALLCTMAANNETGVVSDLAGIAAALEGSAALWMVDCVQALGKLALDLAATRIDYAPFSGHKLHAPKGTGLLYVRAGAPFTPLMTGGGQEGGGRSGTENMPGIAALGAVLAALEQGGTFCTHATMLDFRDRLATALQQAFPGIVFNAPFDAALPTTLNFSVPGQSSKTLLDLFDAAGVRVSAGSACSAAQAQPSYVLEAMGLPAWRSSSAVRLSFGPLADAALIDAACRRIAFCGQALQESGRHESQHEPAQDLPSAGGFSGSDQADTARDTNPDVNLDAAALAALLLAHPETLLVDVREPYEHAAGTPFAAATVVNIPLGDLARQLPALLEGGTTPLVFFCRSGNRSSRAVECLRSHGHRHAWHLAGGLALVGSRPTPL